MSPINNMGGLVESISVSDLEWSAEGRRLLIESGMGDSSGDEVGLALERGTALSRFLARKSVCWARDSLQRLPIRLTLENVGMLSVVVSAFMPRALTYLLLYPLFRLVFGTLYPAYASYKAVRTKNVKEYVKWMMYWIVFALFTCAETFTDVFFSFWFPFYYEIKIILVLWLLSPATKGSSILYRRFVHPALCQRETEIDEALARATEQGYSAVLQLGSKGVNYATTVLMQTAIKGGGGLVQQLRKSYSLSDLTGEKEDENHRSDRSPDEVDLHVPCLREKSGRRGYSPRRTQSSNNQMEMYFSEVDVEVRQSRSKEPAGSLTNIKSTDDISSGYSSGEALQSQKSSITRENLVRTASVGARSRTKPRTTTKKTPEVEEIEEEDEEIENIQRLPFVNPLTFLNSQQVFEILSYLSDQKDRQIMLQHHQNLSDSDDDSTLKADIPCSDVESKKLKKKEISVVDLEEVDYEVKDEESCINKIVIDVNKINEDLCSDKFNKLKELLQSANKAVASLVSSQENLSQTDDLSGREISAIQKATNSLEIKSSPNVFRSNSDCIERAGKYHKKPAPKAPEISARDEDEDEEEKPLKATLVIKTGTIQSFTNNEAVDAVIRRRKKANTKTAARDSFTKFLTIPKNLFHNAFHKDKEEDARSLSSNKSSSRSGSYENIKNDVDVTNVLLNAANEGKKKSGEEDSTYISLRPENIDAYFPVTQSSTDTHNIHDENLKKSEREETIV